jgi:hypothetical protein
LGNIFGDAVNSGIAFAQQNAAGVIDKTAKGNGTDVVNPLHRRFRIGDNVLSLGVVKVTVTGHKYSLFRINVTTERYFEQVI